MFLNSIYTQCDVASKAWLVCCYRHFRAVIYSNSAYIQGIQNFRAHQSPILGKSSSQSIHHRQLVWFQILYDAGTGMEGDYSQIQYNNHANKNVGLLYQWCWSIHALNANCTSCLILSAMLWDPRPGHHQHWVVRSMGHLQQGSPRWSLQEMPTHQFVSVSAIHPQYMQRQHKSGHTAIGLSMMIMMMMILELLATFTSNQLVQGSSSAES